MEWSVRLRGELIWRGPLDAAALGKIMLTFVCVVDSGYREIALVDGGE